MMLGAAGIVVFGLAYSLFAAVPASAFMTTSDNNRIAAAGALGTAMIQVGTIGLLAGVLTRNTPAKEACCLIISVVCGSGFVATSTLGLFWVSAFRTQQQVLSDIRVRFPTLPSRTTFILDGVCANVGPGAIFRTDYDLAGALQILYRDRTIRANVVTPSTTVEKEYLRFEGDWGESLYPYERNLVVYDSRRKMSTWLVDVEDARRYFTANDPRRSDDCGSQEAEPF